MRGKIGAVVAALAATASAAGAALWAKRRRDQDALDLEATPSGDQGMPVAENRAAEESATPATVDGGADDLTAIKGIGAARAESLRGIGVTTFAQIATWGDADIDEVAPQVKVTPDRIRREDWVGQARTLGAN